MAFQSRAEKNKVREGEKLRREDIQSHIDKIQTKKKELEARGRELLQSGKSEDPEYNELIEKHRQLRGKQRFFEGMQSEVGPSSEIGVEARQKDAYDRELSRDRAGKSEETTDALDRLLRESKEKK